MNLCIVRKQYVIQSNCLNHLAQSNLSTSIGGISASEWKTSQEWKNRGAREIELEIDEAMMTKDEEHALQL